MRKMFSAAIVACMLTLLSALSIPVVQASPVMNAEGTLTWLEVNFEGTRKAGINTIYQGTSTVAAGGTFDGDVTDAWVEVWHAMKFLNLRDVLTFTGKVDGKSGTLTIRLVGIATLPDIVWTSGQWEIMRGTGDLANLQGQGTWWGTGNNVEYSGLIQFE